MSELATNLRRLAELADKCGYDGAPVLREAAIVIDDIEEQQAALLRRLAELSAPLAAS